MGGAGGRRGGTWPRIGSIIRTAVHLLLRIYRGGFGRAISPSERAGRTLAYRKIRTMAAWRRVPRPNVKAACSARVSPGGDCGGGGWLALPPVFCDDNVRRVRRVSGRPPKVVDPSNQPASV